MGRVKNKRVLITGAASGLGLADSQLLSEQGAIILMTDIDEQQCELKAKEINSKTGNPVFSVKLDVGSECDWQNAMTLAKQNMGGLDVLVNNAGLVIVADPETTSLQQYQLAQKVMSEGTFLGCKYAIALMKETSDKASIINMSSTASKIGFPIYAAYTAAKGAVTALTRSVAVHCKSNNYNIRCNSIHPAGIDTPMIDQSASLIGIDKKDMPPLGEPIDVANMVLFLASDESLYVNGTELFIDNAVTIGG